MRCPDQGPGCITIELCRKSYFSKYDVFKIKRCHCKVSNIRDFEDKQTARYDRHQIKFLGIIFRYYHNLNFTVKGYLR